jgi:sugar lactone lactonase YvrE
MMTHAMEIFIGSNEKQDQLRLAKASMNCGGNASLLPLKPRTQYIDAYRFVSRWHAPLLTSTPHMKKLSPLLVVAVALVIFSQSYSAHADTLYVSNFSNGTIEKFTPSGSGSTFANTGSTGPTGLAFDAVGNLFVANDSPTGYTIEQFASSGSGSTFANTGLSSPHGLAFDSAGNLFVANVGNSTIEKFTPAGVGSVFADSTVVDHPIGLAFDGAGNLFVANEFGGPSDSGTIVKLTSAGVASVFANTGLNNPYGLAFDIAGNLYATNFSDNTIEKFTSVGVGSVFANSGLSQPHGLAIDSLGNVYAANGNDTNNQPTNTIEKFSSTGIDLGIFANTGLDGPTFIAFQPVPELRTAIGSWFLATFLIGLEICRRFFGPVRCRSRLSNQRSA